MLNKRSIEKLYLQVDELIDEHYEVVNGDDSPPPSPPRHRLCIRSMEEIARDDHCDDDAPPHYYYTDDIRQTEIARAQAIRDARNRAFGLMNEADDDSTASTEIDDNDPDVIAETELATQSATDPINARVYDIVRRARLGPND